MSVSELSEIISPAFTEETVLQIVKNKTTFSDIQILKIVIADEDSSKGDSYLSSLCRFQLTANGKSNSGNVEEITLPVIVKYFPKNIARRKTFRSADFFKTEIDFYEKVWPVMKKFKLSKIPDEMDEVPLLLASYCDGEHDFIALEDLSYQGFKTASRNDKQTKETILLNLKLIANFHALSLALKEQQPEFEKIAGSLEETYFGYKLRSWYENFLYQSLVPHYQKAAKDLLPQEYYDKVTKFFSGDYYGQLCKSCCVHNKLSVVTEGDAWLPNFLVKDDDGKLTVVLIDFQLARYSIFSSDLIQFLYSCVPKEMLVKEWNSLIAHYHQYLSSRIEKLGGDKNFVTLSELEKAINEYPLVGVAMAMESKLMSLLTNDEVTDINLLQGEDAIPLEDVWILPEFEQERNEELAFLIKHFVDKGFIP